MRAVLAVGLFLLAGCYLAAVWDGLTANRLAARPATPGHVLALPVRRAALLLLQQGSGTERPDTQLWVLAPALLGALAAVAVALVPLGPQLVAAEVDGGIVVFGAAAALVMVAVFLQGWSANSVQPLIGGYRFIAQALSYEMPLVLVLIAAALPARSLSVGEIVASQDHLWNVLRQPLGLPLFLGAGLGLAFWGPLALPEGTDLAGGTSAELSGTARLVWRLAQLCVLVAVSAMGAAVFLGGQLGPVLPGPVWVILKTALLLFVLTSARHHLARVPIERFVVPAWTLLIPLALIDVAWAGVQALAAGR